MNEAKGEVSSRPPGKYATSTAILESQTTIHAIAWPTVALIVFLCARSPVTHILNAVANKLQGVSAMYVGKLELHFDRETPHPADDIASALRVLTATEVEKILKHSYQDGEGCRKWNEVPSNLIQTRLLERKTPGDCAVATGLGSRTRDFLFSLMAAEVANVPE
jgi:hypothetical protein